MGLTASTALDRLRTRRKGLNDERSRILRMAQEAAARLDEQIVAVERAITVLSDARQAPVADALLDAIDQAGLKLVVSE